VTGNEREARLVAPTPLTIGAAVATAAMIAWSFGYLIVRYPGLPQLLPVHFRPDGLPDGWQFKTAWRVLLPVFVQMALALLLGAIGVLLLSRTHGSHDKDAPDVRAAATAAEAVALLTLIWVAFQAYGAVALASMWQRERAGLGRTYNYFELAGVVLTIVAAVRAQRRLGHPAPRPFVSEHWRYGQLYKNADDPALFVPTRHGNRWTLNFGRPATAVLMAVILILGIVCPAVILGLLLR
jgi:uncharacterized membrane protein